MPLRKKMLEPVKVEEYHGFFIYYDPNEENFKATAHAHNTYGQIPDNEIVFCGKSQTQAESHIRKIVKHQKIPVLIEKYVWYSNGQRQQTPIHSFVKGEISSISKSGSSYDAIVVYKDEHGKPTHEKESFSYTIKDTPENEETIRQLLEVEKELIHYTEKQKAKIETLHSKLVRYETKDAEEIVRPEKVPID